MGPQHEPADEGVGPTGFVWSAPRPECGVHVGSDAPSDGRAADAIVGSRGVPWRWRAVDLRYGSSINRGALAFSDGLMPSRFATVGCSDNWPTSPKSLPPSGCG